MRRARAVAGHRRAEVFEVRHDGAAAGAERQRIEHQHAIPLRDVYLPAVSLQRRAVAFRRERDAAVAAVGRVVARRDRAVGGNPASRRRRAVALVRLEIRAVGNELRVGVTLDASRSRRPVVRPDVRIAAEVRLTARAVRAVRVDPEARIPRAQRRRLQAGGAQVGGLVMLQVLPDSSPASVVSFVEPSSAAQPKLPGP